ncbi:MAG: signal peptidase I [Spirochaetaceae bacterium]|nr:signal peptidase I [Spirochaetaceae bacterium]
MTETVIDYSFMLKQKRRAMFFKYSVFVIVVLTVLIVLHNFILFSVGIASESMQPTLATGDVVFVTPLAKPYGGQPENRSVLDRLVHCVSLNRGDLVLLNAGDDTRAPKYKKVANKIVRFITFQRFSLFSTYSDDYCVRRILGFPGDTVYMKDFVVYIKPADENHFLTEYELSSGRYDVITEKLPDKWDNGVGFSGELEPVVLGNNQYMFFSDDRYHCSDSRLWGRVDADCISGKIVLRYWPFMSFSLF